MLVSPPEFTLTGQLVELHHTVRCPAFDAMTAPTAKHGNHLFVRMVSMLINMNFSLMQLRQEGECEYEEQGDRRRETGGDA